MSLTPSPAQAGTRKWGTKDLQTPRWSAVRRGRAGRFGRLLSMQEQASRVRPTALCSLRFEGEKETARDGAANENRD